MLTLLTSTVSIMTPFRLTLAALLLLSACGGNPFVEEPDTEPEEPVIDTGGITTDGGLPPGTTSPTPRSGITRFEPKGNDKLNGDSGNGYVKTVTYDSVNDTFKVDNLGFDGNNVFGRSTRVGSLGPYAVYEGKPSVPDSVTGTPITQLSHAALYGVSSDGAVKFAIVRTGSYIDYGFGGFIYARSGGVTLPAEGAGTGEPENPGYRGQAHYEGQVAGIRDFKARTGMEYTEADMEVDIDFDDFNDGNAVKGRVYNRRIYDQDGNDITQGVLDGLTTESGVSQTEIPTLFFTIGPGVMNDNGEIHGLLGSSYLKDTGALEQLDEGHYYALVSGAGADQRIVGVFVVEADDPRYDGVTVRETGGFILERQ